MPPTEIESMYPAGDIIVISVDGISEINRYILQYGFTIKHWRKFDRPDKWEQIVQCA